MAKPSNLDKEVGRRVKVAAKATGISHTALALEAGIAKRTFDYLIVGQARWRMTDLYAVADALEVDALDLLPRVRVVR